MTQQEEAVVSEAPADNHTYAIGFRFKENTNKICFLGPFLNLSRFDKIVSLLKEVGADKLSIELYKGFTFSKNPVDNEDEWKRNSDWVFMSITGINLMDNKHVQPLIHCVRHYENNTMELYTLDGPIFCDTNSVEYKKLQEDKDEST